MRRLLFLNALILGLSLSLSAQVQTITVSQGATGANRVRVNGGTLSVKAAMLHMGQSNARGVESTMPGSNLPTEMQDSADVLKEVFWSFSGPKYLRRSYPTNISPIKRTADSLLTGAKQPYQLYLPYINPLYHIADWNRGGTALMSGYFNPNTSSLYNMDDWISWILAQSSFKKEYAVAVWSQGEDEMEDPDPAPSQNYAENWFTWATDFRAAFGYRIPIFIVKMHTYTGGGLHYSTMISEQTTMAQQVGNCYLIDVTGLGANSIHYVYSEHVVLAGRVCNAIAAYHNRPKILSLQ